MKVWYQQNRFKPFSNYYRSFQGVTLFAVSCVFFVFFFCFFFLCGVLARMPPLLSVIFCVKNSK